MIKFYSSSLKFISLLAIFTVSFLNGFSTIPPNDEPCDAIAITVVGTTCSPGTAVYTNDSATDSSVPDPGCAAYQGQDIWFTVVVPASGNIKLEGGAGTMSDGAMAVYRGTCTALIDPPLDCDDDGGTGLLPMIQLSCLAPGETLYVRYWGYFGSIGTFQICAYDGGCTAPQSLTLNGDFSPCAGDTILYWATAPALSTPYTYNWIINNGQVISGGGVSDSLVTVVWTSSGTSSIEVSIACCGIYSFPRYRQVNICTRSTAPTATALAPSVCSVCFDQLSVTSGTLGSCAQWVWYKDSCYGPIVGYGASILVYPTATTTYFVNAENSSGGCPTGCDQVTVSVYIVGTSDLNGSGKFMLYPNPVSDYLTIKAEGIGNGNLEYTLTNTLSQVMKTGFLDISNHSFDMNLDMTSLGAGMYFLYFNSGESKQVFRVLKQ